MTTFASLGLIQPLLRAITDEGYVEPTPIQLQAIPLLLEGRDLLGCAKTGTGKTAAFALPILQYLANEKRRAQPRSPLVLAVVPTRELAAQVAQSFETYGAKLDLRVAVIFGGVGQGSQVAALSRGVDILVATPGRLLDLKNQGNLRLDRVEILVLDEADQMLDMGFIPDVRRILAAVPKDRQTLLFSATMPPVIAKLAEGILVDPARVTITPPASTVELIEQSVYLVSRAAKPGLIARLLSRPEVERALVFTRTKRGADRVSKRLVQDGIAAQAIHGNKSQGQRERTLDSFREGRTRVLVATDIAARGIDIEGLSHVFNYEIPNIPEQYVHRIGRTGRAGASGIAISLCDGEERAYLLDIERTIRRSIPIAGKLEGDHGPAHAPRAPRPAQPRRAPSHAPAHAPAHARHSDEPRGERPAAQPRHAPTHAPRPAGGHGPARSHGGPSRSSHGSKPAHRPAHGGGGGARGGSHGPSHRPTSRPAQRPSHGSNAKPAHSGQSAHSSGDFGAGV
jgi:ATP-dependent RNA helicase RhlE